MHLLVVFCKPILAILLQRKHHTIDHQCIFWLCVVNPSLQYCYKENRRSSMHLLVVCCKPILEIVLQSKRLIARMHHELCKPIIAIQRKHQTIVHQCIFLLCVVNPSLQDCYKENIRRSSMHLESSHSSVKLSFERVSLHGFSLVKERSYEVPGAHERLGMMLAKNPPTYLK